MSGKGRVDALFVLIRMDEEYLWKKKSLFMCFVDLGKAFDRVPRKLVEWAMRKKEIPEMMVIAETSLSTETTNWIKVGSDFSTEFLKISNCDLLKYQN